MKLFRSKDEKLEEKAQEYIKERGLEGLDEDDILNITDVLKRYISREAGDVNTALSKSLREGAILDHQRAIMEQNWIIIKKLDEISKKLDK